MNLFPIEIDPKTGHPCPIRSAQHVADEHFKIILEAVQMMMTAYRGLTDDTEWIENMMTYARDIWLKELQASMSIEKKSFSLEDSMHAIEKRQAPKSTHSKHPMTLWVGKSLDHFIWTAKYAQEMCRERLRRPLLSGGKSKMHMYRPYIDWLHNNPPFAIMFPQIGWTDMPLCMDDKYKYSSDGQLLDVVHAYRNWVNHKYNTWQTCRPSKHKSSTLKRKIDWRRDPSRRPSYIYAIFQYEICI